MAQTGVFHANSEIVVVPLAVVDENGSAVDGLTRGDFQVFDNGVRRTIQNFWVDSSMPLKLGIVID